MENALILSRFTNACKQIRVPFSSSDEEKVLAIQIIAAHDSEEGVAILKKAFHMVREPLSAQRATALTTTARGGIVANSAGMALAQSKRAEGLNYLIYVASSKRESSIQREIAVRSLASARNREAMRAILLAMKDDDDTVMRAAIDSCAVALRVCDADLRDDVNAILMTIFKLAFAQMEREVPDDVAVQAYGLLITYATDEIMHCLVRAINMRPRISLTEYYYRALLECASPAAPRFIIQLLTANLPELSWYGEIGKRLELSTDPVVRRTATNLLEDTTLTTRIKATMDPRFAKRIVQQKLACRVILGH